MGLKWQPSKEYWVRFSLLEYYYKNKYSMAKYHCGRWPVYQSQNLLVDFDRIVDFAIEKNKVNLK